MSQLVSLLMTNTYSVETCSINNLYEIVILRFFPSPPCPILTPQAFSRSYWGFNKKNQTHPFLLDITFRTQTESIWRFFNTATVSIILSNQPCVKTNGAYLAKDKYCTLIKGLPAVLSDLKIKELQPISQQYHAFESYLKSNQKRLNEQLF